MAAELTPGGVEPGDPAAAAAGAEERVTQAALAIDVNGRVIEWSEPAELMFGWTRDEITGRSLASTIVPPFYRAAHRRGLEAFRSSGPGRVIGRVVEVSALHRDGTEFPVELLVTERRDDDGAVSFLGLVRDISRRRRSDLLRSMQLNVSRQLMELVSPQAGLPRVLEAVRSTLRCQVAALWLRAEGREELLRRHVSHASTGPVTEFVRAAAGMALPHPELVARVWQTGLPYIVAAGSPHGNALMARAERGGLRWMAAFPLAQADPRAGALVLFAVRAPVVDEDLLTAMGSVGSQVGQALARAQAEQALRDSERNYRVLFEGTPLPILVCDAATLRFLAVNEAAVATYGYSVEEFLGMHADDIRAPDVQDGDRWGGRAGLGEGAGEASTRVSLRRHRLRNGRVIDVELTTRVESFGGRPATLHLVHDITDRLALQRGLWQQAYHDSLTGLANRALFIERLEQALARSGEGASCAVLLLDLDDFKAVNDSRGHHAGDQLLRAVARRLSAAVRSGDVLARLGGDEFAVLLEDVTSISRAKRAAEALLAALREPFSIDDKEVVAGATAGIAVGDATTRRADDILRNADLAMYAAKAGGRSRYQAFHPDMHAAMLERVALQQEMRAALEADQLRLLYQPQIELATGRITGVEALVRWEHPTRGLLGPGAFIPLAEDAGLIHPLGAWVLRAACHQAQEWVRRGLPPVQVAVNLSGRELGQADLARRVRRALRSSGLNPALLEVEITETGVVDQPHEALARLEELRGLGVQVAIDDFGTGYSMLSRLQVFPVDKLKIDKSFIDGVTLATDPAPLVIAMVAMGHGLGLRVLAEGVEYPEQLAFLRRHGCDEVQGHLISEPVTAQRFEELLRRSAAGATLAHWSEPELEPLGVVSEMVDAASTLEDVLAALLTKLETLTGFDTTCVTELERGRERERVLSSQATPGRRSTAGRGRPGRRAGGSPRSRPPVSAAGHGELRADYSVPIVLGDGTVFGRLWGRRRSEPGAGVEPMGLMELFSRVIAVQVDGYRSRAGGLRVLAGGGEDASAPV